jgi:hypothetical protein
MEVFTNYFFRIFGIRLGTMLFAFIIILGQLLFSLGGFFDRLWIMELGRFVFGKRCYSYKQIFDSVLYLIIYLCCGFVMFISDLGSEMFIFFYNPNPTEKRMQN